MPLATNHLIQSLPRKDRQRLQAICEPVELVLAEILTESDARTRYVYFPTVGFVSVVARLDGKAILEVGMVGREGMCGVHVALGAHSSPQRLVVQGAGLAGRASAADFSRELDRSAALRKILNRYIHINMLQLATMATCLRYHLIGQRLARWLLMTHDRAHADTFRVTHEFLALMLGVRRVGITDAAGILQRSGLIDYKRGELTVVSRRGLQAAACGCYAENSETYAAFL